MYQTADLADEDLRRTLRALSADVQAALALARVTLHTVAATSPSVQAAAERALQLEADEARRAGKAPRVVAFLEQTGERLERLEEEEARMIALERALIAAADALPDTPDFDLIEAARA